MNAFQKLFHSLENDPKKAGILLAASLLVLFFYNVDRTFDPKLGMSGDNAHYIILGKSISTGEGYTNIHQVEKLPHKHFPPGYPMLIALTSPLTDLEVEKIKRVNQALLLLSFIILFYLFYLFSEQLFLSFMATAFCMANAHLYVFSSQAMSEIPFMLMLLLSILFFVRSDYEKPLNKNLNFLLYILLLNAAIYTRSMGVVVLIAASIILIQKRKVPYLVAQWIASLLIQIPWVLRTRKLGGNTYINQIMRKNPYRANEGLMEFGDWFTRIFENLQRYISREIPSGTISYLNVETYKVPPVAMEWLVGIGVCLVIIFGLIRIRKHRIFLIWLSLGYMGILMLWPDIWFGIRFILPLLPVLILFLFIGLFEIYNFLIIKLLPGFKDLEKGLFVLLFIFIVFPYNQYATKKAAMEAKYEYPKTMKNFFTAANWVKQNTPKVARVACIKGGLFHIMSERVVCSPKRSSDPWVNYERFRENKVDVIIIDNVGFSSTGDYLVPVLNSFPENAKLAVEIPDPTTQIFKFFPYVGYKGELKNGLRNGQGEFTYISGEVYTGQWKDNAKHGPGRYYFPDGTFIEGAWTRDTLSGWVNYYGANGRYVERREYRNNKFIQGDGPSARINSRN